MKRYKSVFRQRPIRKCRCCIAFSYFCVVVAVLLGWLYRSVPDVIYIEQGSAVAIGGYPFLTAQRQMDRSSVVSTSEPGSYNLTLAVGGVLPLKQVRAIVTKRPVVTVCGTPFGIKMFSDGALVVGFGDLSVAGGRANPAKEAGLKLGDRIISMGGLPTRSNEELRSAIEKAEGQSVTVVYVRDGSQRSASLTPVKDNSGSWKAGMWVRDSSAGVGTLTFVDESVGVFAGLGHSINDSDTGACVALRSGEIVSCEIVGCTCGSAGRPGELKGHFTGSFAMGTIVLNDQTGVYGTTRRSFAGKQCELAFAQEVTTGSAVLITTIEGTKPQEYTVEIEKVSLAGGDKKRNLILRVTDPRLLQATGGIVQGMSGSPILQNGRLVGAVTHVLVDDPTRGYAIFAQTMLEQSRQLPAQKVA